MKQSFYSQFVFENKKVKQDNLIISFLFLVPFSCFFMKYNELYPVKIFSAIVIGEMNNSNIYFLTHCFYLRIHDKET